MDSYGIRHRDAFGRVTVIAEQDAGQEHYLRPLDGRLVPLLVQGVSDAHETLDTSNRHDNWKRTGRPQPGISPIIELVRWTYSSVFVEGSEERRSDFGSILATALLIPQNLEGRLSNGGYYDPVRTQDRAYPKVALNKREDRVEAFETREVGEVDSLLDNSYEMTLQTRQTPKFPDEGNFGDLDGEFDDLPVRHFGPRYLCFLKDGPNGSGTTCETWKVADWVRKYGADADTGFVFLSYTRKQFWVYTEDDMANWTTMTIEEKAMRSNMAIEDRTMLKRYGIEAARSAGKRAFWLDFECIRDIDHSAKATSQSADVYRIGDIARAAHSLVILVGPSVENRLPGGIREEYSADSMTSWLRVWGSRLWTLPEILLSDTECRVKLYAIGGPMPPETLAKRNFAERAIWRDGHLVRQLVDHYESAIHLTPLELASIGLECFANRTTEQFSPGDIAYALMGLLRRRPPVDKSDTSFEAFARLSLANDSDALLERLLCMQPLRSDREWHSIEDAWGARLWHIEPKCQIAAIADDQTVVLDGAYGATIQWNKMDHVAFFKRATISRLIGKILLRGVPLYFIIGLAMTIAGAVLKQQSSGNSESDEFGSSTSSESFDTSSSSNYVALSLLIPGLIFLVPSSIIVLAAPAMLVNIYAGKFWSTQALFYGIEGIPSIGEVERHLFGFNHGRLKWSIAGSTLSRHKISADGERIGLEPHPPKLAQEGDRADNLVFTLIDTYAMEVTAFRAARPPSAVIVCGQEGGMQRAALCSYDWKRNTFAREQVIRVKTTILDRMSRMDRFRFALKRPADSAVAQDLSWLGEKLRTPTHSAWKTDLALMPFMFATYALGTAASYPVEWLAASAGVFAVQFLAPLVISRLHLGHSLAVAIFLAAALKITYVFVPQGDGNAKLAALSFFQGAAAGFLTPAYVFLTYAWYETSASQVMRIIIWTSSQFLLDGVGWQLEYSGAPGDSYRYVIVAWGAICIILAGYAYLFLGTPEQVSWGPVDPRLKTTVKAKAARQWRTSSIPRLLRYPEPYFLFFLTLLCAASPAIVSTQSRHQATTDLVFVMFFLVPLICAIILGVLFSRFSRMRVLIVFSLVTATFIGYFVSVRGSVGGATNTAPGNARIFLFNLPLLTEPFVWCLVLFMSLSAQEFVSALVVVFGAQGLGRIIVYAVQRSWPGSEFTELRHIPFKSFRIYLIVVFSLQMVALASWTLYRMLIKRTLKYSGIGHGDEDAQQNFARDEYRDSR